MPMPMQGEKQADYIKRAVKMMMGEEGMTQKHALGKAHGMFRSKSKAARKIIKKGRKSMKSMICVVAFSALAFLSSSLNADGGPFSFKRKSGIGAADSTTFTGNNTFSGANSFTGATTASTFTIVNNSSFTANGPGKLGDAAADVWTVPATISATGGITVSTFSVINGSATVAGTAGFSGTETHSGAESHTGGATFSTFTLTDNSSGTFNGDIRIGDAATDNLTIVGSSVTIPAAGLFISSGVQSPNRVLLALDPTNRRVGIGMVPTEALTIYEPVNGTVTSLEDYGSGARLTTTAGTFMVNAATWLQFGVGGTAYGAVSTSGFQPYARTAAQLATLAPAGTGDLIYCSDCTGGLNTNSVNYTSTGTGAGAWVWGADGFTPESGYEGYVSSVSAVVQNCPATGTYGDLVSITLIAGDWDISGMVQLANNGATATSMAVGISTTSGNSTAGLAQGDSWMSQTGPTAITDVSATIANHRVLLSASATYYLKYMGAFSAGTPQAYGRISARRVR